MTIASISKNPYPKTAIATVQFHGHRFLVLDETVRPRAMASLDEHSSIAAALEVQDGAMAGRHTLEHVRKAEDMLAGVLPVI